MIAYAAQTSWLEWLIIATLLMMFASLVHLVICGFSCDPRIRKGCWLDPLTDAIPWLFSWTCLKLTGRTMPAWLPWALALGLYVSILLLV
jgi:hypothetical protein